MRYFILLLWIDLVNGISIGKIPNCTYIPENSKPIIVRNATCESCLCRALTVSTASQIIVNCYKNWRSCEIFLNYSINYTMVRNANATFYFYPNLPPIINQTRNSNMLKWNTTGKIVAGVTSTISAAANNLNNPLGMAFDSKKNLYVVDHFNNRIQRFANGSSQGVTVAGSSDGLSGATLSLLLMPVSIVFDLDDNMYITDRGNNRILFWAQGSMSGILVAGTGFAGSRNNELNFPATITRAHATGYLYVSDAFNHRVMRFVPGILNGTIVAGGNGPGASFNQLSFPYGLYLDEKTSSLYIANYGTNTIVRWILGQTNWSLVAGISSIAGRTPVLLSAPYSIVLDRFSNIYVADTFNNRIQLFQPNQSNATSIAGVSTVAGSQLDQLFIPQWAILDEDLNLYVADTFNHRIMRFDVYQ